MPTNPVRTLIVETCCASGAYLAAIVFTFSVLMPVQNLLFPEYPSRASLLFLPHGVRVLSAWLLGWRAIPAMLPGVLAAFVYVAGWDAFQTSRLIAILIAASVAPITFHALKRIGWDLFPASDKCPCWICIMGVGVLTSVLTSTLTNLAFGSSPIEFVAFLIGDISGLFFGMLILLYLFRLAPGRN